LPVILASPETPSTASVTWSNGRVFNNETVDKDDVAFIMKLSSKARGATDFKHGIVFGRAGKEWYFDTELERDTEFLRLLALGLIEKGISIPDILPEGT